MNPKTLVVAQLLISFQMALIMSGIFSALELGLTVQWLLVWGKQFIVAWPVAFVFSILTSRVAFPIAEKWVPSQTRKA
ncbi:hypothetical protein MED297_00585 [Reinekea sp. MED297]|uniref:DUF2798 domain-containing protein n=1 Tax=Reinekea blandensis MED297 TaxID=314283 RepID=A4BID2_9GAMM|nr:hypothetical protein MED297_00585 [Reinekea sp. MED297] [Reinekea blandensis MED297]